MIPGRCQQVTAPAVQLRGAIPPHPHKINPYQYQWKADGFLICLHGEPWCLLILGTVPPIPILKHYWQCKLLPLDKQSLILVIVMVSRRDWRSWRAKHWFSVGFTRHKCICNLGPFYLGHLWVAKEFPAIQGCLRRRGFTLVNGDSGAEGLAVVSGSLNVPLRILDVWWHEYSFYLPEAQDRSEITDPNKSTDLIATSSF